MLPLAHMGITVTIARVMERKIKRQVVDYRILLVGSLLPDLIDKPVGYLLFNTPLTSSKLFGHSLLLLVFLGSIGFVLWHRRRSLAGWMFFAGAAAHDILDAMWLHPKILFWPLFGWLFVTPGYEAWVGTIKLGALSIPKLVALEILGGLLLIHFFAVIFLNEGIMSFFKHGKVNLTRAGR